MTDASKGSENDEYEGSTLKEENTMKEESSNITVPESVAKEKETC